MCGPNPALQAVDHSITHPMVVGEPDWQYCGTCREHVSKHPDKMNFLAKREMELIIEQGHQVQLIFPHEGDEGVPFAYSVGRSVKDRPELLVTGPLPGNMLGYIVNRVAELDDENEISAGDELDDVLSGYPVRIVEVANLDHAEMFGVTQHFMDATALQILWPDKEGRFPGDEGYTTNQPVYDKETVGELFAIFRDCEECGTSVLTMLDEGAPKTCEGHSA
jgi:hypothetical protein